MKKIKDKSLNARVDDAYHGKVQEYIHAADMNMGDLVRDAVSEYMANHPARIATPVKPSTLSKLKGEK